MVTIPVPPTDPVTAVLLLGITATPARVVEAEEVAAAAVAAVVAEVVVAVAVVVVVVRRPSRPGPYHSLFVVPEVGVPNEISSTRAISTPYECNSESRLIFRVEWVEAVVGPHKLCVYDWDFPAPRPMVGNCSAC